MEGGRNEGSSVIFLREMFVTPLSLSFPPLLYNFKGHRNSFSGERGGVGEKERRERWGEKDEREIWESGRTPLALPQTRVLLLPGIIFKIQMFPRVISLSEYSVDPSWILIKIKIFISCRADKYSGMDPCE